MAILDIVTLPDPILRQVSARVETVDDDVRRLLDDMLATMYHDDRGVGLAGNQVGVARRIITIDAARREEEAAPDPLFLINPEILWRSDERGLHEEGCLSIPDTFAEVERPERIRVRFLDYHGDVQEREAGGFLARVMQHEIDHLDGRLIIDYLSKLKRDMVVRRFAKAARQAASDGAPRPAP